MDAGRGRSAEVREASSQCSCSVPSSRAALRGPVTVHGPPRAGGSGPPPEGGVSPHIILYSSALEICFFSPFVCLNQYALNDTDFVLRIKVPCDFIFGLWPFQPRPPGGPPGGAPVSCGTPRSCGIVGTVVGRVFTSWPHRGPGPASYVPCPSPEQPFLQGSLFLFLEHEANIRALGVLLKFL